MQALQELQGLVRQAKVQVIRAVLEIARAVQILPVRPLGCHRLTERQHSSFMFSLILSVSFSLMLSSQTLIFSNVLHHPWHAFGSFTGASGASSGVFGRPMC